jgi:antitoxin MazE
MRTTLRRIGNSQGVLIPAPLLAECGITGEIDLHLEGKKIIIEPVRSPREGWFAHFTAANEMDAWEGLPPDADEGEWSW